ncbi:uncharacterized protein LOC115963005 isoform X2 [Quercus lobata]|uniref:uncharacterized protein LOC115963005 isoform X2 n=1 Tax=Quercus lobata TaxID=97700 RepID=UPI00124616FA|nr:uncharacterized protein LOC115963005 isoform X2 [Quercus lobata]
MDILTRCTGSAAAEVVKCTAKPVIRHVGYLFRFKKTVADLTKAKKDLQLEQQKVQEAIERAAMNNEIAEKDVERWLTNVNQLMEEVQALEIKVQVNLRFCNGWCPDWIRQYKLCKEAIQKTNVVKELQDRGKFSELTHRAPTPGIEIFSSSDFEVFESTKLAFQQIMEALRDDNSKRIGLHGIGGVGKTTLVKEVHKKTKELNIFNEIVMTVVSLTPNVRRIQGEIAGCLNLKLDDESDMARASQICLRIKSVEKILIILDDVWKDVNLEAIGIPSSDDHKGCKMLLTTRSVHVCNLMRCQRKIPLNFLVEEESLALMKKTAVVDDCPGLNDVVLEVVKECKGLPIAIITVGKALTGKSLNDWNAAMHQLRKSRLVDIEGVDEDKNAYACLKWSFDQLKRKTKLCFLLCSLFPEDYNIPVEELTICVMGLEEDEDFHLLEDARCQVRAAVDSLKDSSLLLEGSQKEFVKMHDMVRDIGLWITSKGENEFELRACTRLERNTNFERATAISLIDFNTKQLPDKLVCPRLNILLLGGIQSSKNISNALFEGMNCLKVLSLHDIILSSQSLELLTNLRTLYLKRCDFNDDLSSLGKLKRLETLRFFGCVINALPSELGEMVGLKMLDLTDCDQLQHIPPNVIRRLSQLEELIISSSFKNWDVEGTTSEISNANLSELNSLPRLVNLSLLLNSNHLPKGFVFPEHLRRYYIVIGKPYLSAMTPGRTLAIKDLNASSMNALKSLFHTVEYFLIESCEMECIVDTICEGPNQYEIFNNLTVFRASGCPRLISLFSPSLAQSLKRLKKLCLHRCHEMKQIISEEGMTLESHGQPICLSKLETLVVGNCGKLEYIFPISIDLPQLERLELGDLPRLKKVFGQSKEGEVGDCEIESHHQPTGFPKLKTIRVSKCRNLVCLSTARDLPQLESLELRDLPQLKQVFGQNREGEVGDCEIESHHQHTGFPKLKTIQVWNCRNLVCLSTARDLPQLESLELRDLPQLKQVFGQNREGEVGDCEIESDHQPTGFPKLKTIQVWNCRNLVCLSTRDLPQLESLELQDLPQLKQVFGQNREGEVGNCEIESDHQPTGFPKLKTIQVWNCRNLVCLSTARDLPQLESLELRNLPQLKQVFGQNREGEVGDCEIESDHQPTGFPKLKTIQVWKCRNLVCLSTARDLPQLESLELQDLPQLKQVFGQNREGEVGNCEIESHHQPTGFPKLKTIQVWCCENLECLSIAGDLPQLKSLELGDLPQLKKVFSQNREGEVGDCEIESHHQPTGFPKLKNIKVWNCRNLVCLSTARDLPQLERLKLHDLPRLKKVFGQNREGEVGNCEIESDHQPTGFPKLKTIQVRNCRNLVCLSIARDLPQLEGLELDDLPQLKKVFGQNRERGVGDCEIESHHQPTGFPKLKTIKVVNCGNLEYMFPISIARDLPQLESLTLEDLPQLKQVFGHSSSVWPSLKRLYAVNCPKVKLSFFANVEANVPAVQKLQNLQILSLRDWNAISFDGIQGLSNLEELEIENCGGIQEVIKLEGLLTIKGEQQDLLLPRLKKMLLIDLLELRCIWKGTTKLINLNNLEDLKVIRCKKLTHLFTPAPTQSLQKLKFLEIERCDELEHLIVENAEEQVLSESHPQPLCFPKPNVVKVKVESCNKLKCLFHVDRWNAVSIFLRLEELELKNCGGLQEVFNFEGFLTREGEQQDEFFPRLRKMCLVELHELTYIWKGPIQLINLNNLEDLKVIGCKKMTHLFTPALAQSLQKLKFLEIERCDELEHIIVENVEEQVSSENHLQPLCFPKLIRVNVKYCNKLKYLFPMTIADSLLELKILIVKENSQLMEVFTHEGDAGAQKDVTLPLLEFMGLKGLPSLVNFCPKNYQFILLKWRKLRVESCKNMRTTFTRTPDRSVLINGEVAQIDEPTGTSTISPVLTICPANNDIIWDSGGYLSPDGLYFYVEFERC